MIYRIHSLCSDKEDIRNRTVELYRQLLYRGYSRNILVPLFKEAIARALKPTNATATAEVTEEQLTTLRRSVFFHLKYHPLNPPSHAIQRAWQNTIANPPHSRPLADIRNYAGTPIGIERLIIAYQRPFNLGNLLSYRKLQDNSGPPISSYIIRETREV
jgi:hypothetical protein